MVNLRNGLKSCTKNTETPSDYSIIIDDLPINLDEGNENVFERLKVIKFRTDAIRKSPDVWLNCLSCDLMKLYPNVVLKKCLDLVRITMATSIMQGPEKDVDFFGNKMSELVFWLPTRGRVGFCITSMSYANKIQLGISVDKSAVQDRDDLKIILKDVEKAIGDLDVLTEKMTRNLA